MAGYHIIKRIKTFILGKSRDFRDHNIFHKLALSAFLAWVGLGSDGLSSSCYGPAEAFKALAGHPALGIFVAIATGITILIIASSYSHIIELFPYGGGLSCGKQAAFAGNRCHFRQRAAYRLRADHHHFGRQRS